MKRRNARDLRKGIFGPEGGRNIPDCDGGEMEFPLPKGWGLHLTYHPTFGFQAGKVDAEFIPPVIREAVSIPQEAAVTQRKRPVADRWLTRELPVICGNGPPAIKVAEHKPRCRRMPGRLAAQFSTERG
jgi:hypothetical protein